MAEINREQYDIMDKFFRECVKYWERELKTDSDLDKQPFLNALKEVPHNNPYRMQGEPIDPEARKHFIKCRCMDIYGKDWERYYTES